MCPRPTRTIGLSSARELSADDRRESGEGIGGDAVAPAGRESFADTVLMPEHVGGGDASFGSSPRSPPGKRARAAVEPYRFTHTQLPQREPCPGPSRRADPTPNDTVDDTMDVAGVV